MRTDISLCLTFNQWTSKKKWHSHKRWVEKIYFFLLELEINFVFYTLVIFFGGLFGFRGPAFFHLKSLFIPRFTCTIIRFLFIFRFMIFQQKYGFFLFRFVAVFSHTSEFCFPVKQKNVQVCHFRAKIPSFSIHSLSRS